MIKSTTTTTLAAPPNTNCVTMKTEQHIPRASNAVPTRKKRWPLSELRGGKAVRSRG
jgi:hypothetical protein